MNYTPNKNLPQFEEEDIFDINDFNTAFVVIDESLKVVEDEVEWFKRHEHLEYSPINHKHDGYSLENHGHSEYSLEEHQHNDYAPIDHTHEVTGVPEHQHEEYALKGHTHNPETRALPEAEYEALTEADKMNGVIYFVY